MQYKIIKKIPNGNVKIPPSKSISHRAVICSFLSGKKNQIKNLGKSVDISSTIDGIKKILSSDEDVTTINCNESGSTLRFLLPLAATISDRKFIFSGSEKLMSRPMEVYENIFLKSKLLYKRTANGILIQGKLKPGVYNVRGDISSQFISGLLFSLPSLDGDSTIKITTKLESIDYVNLTIDVLKSFGIKISKDGNIFKIKGNQKYKPTDYTIESDYTQASYFLLAKFLGCKVNVLGLNKNSKQGDKEIVNIIKKAKSRKAFTIDASNIPDLVPTIAVLMCFLKGESKIINAARVRLKESDRLQSISTELNKIGGSVVQTKDGLIIKGVKQLTGGTVDT
jgi:3-phosphoshikimate 1-carboxyvinyltransferase